MQVGDLSSTPRACRKKAGIVVNACNPRTGEAGTGRFPEAHCPATLASVASSLPVTDQSLEVKLVLKNDFPDYPLASTPIHAHVVCSAQ